MARLTFLAAPSTLSGAHYPLAADDEPVLDGAAHPLVDIRGIAAVVDPARVRARLQSVVMDWRHPALAVVKELR